MSLAQQRPVSVVTPARSATFYRQVMGAVAKADIPFLVGGGYALEHYTSIPRRTKDLDIFVRRASLEPALEAIKKFGYRTEITHPHFLGKAYMGKRYVDVIFSSGNGSCDVDDWWFQHADEGQIIGQRVLFCPIEEMIWSKAFVMERERYDGHDVTHLIRVGGRRIDWRRLLARFGPNWRVLLAHLVLFGFVYPGDRDRVPDEVIGELLDRLRREKVLPADRDLCRGTLLSRSQYLYDIERLGFIDARVKPVGPMTADHTARWTAAIDPKDQ